MFSVKKRWEGAHADAIWAVKWKDDKHLWTGGVDEVVILRDAEGGEVDRIEGHQWGVMDFYYDPKQGVMVSTSMDNHLRVYSFKEKRFIHQIMASPMQAWSIAYCQQGGRLVSGSREGKVFAWDLEKGERGNVIHDARKFVHAVASSGDGKWLAIGCIDGTIKVLNGKNGSVDREFTCSKKTIRKLVFSRNGAELYAASDDGKAYIINCKDGQVLQTVGHDGWVTSIAISPLDDVFATCGADGSVKIWSTDDFTLLHAFSDHKGRVWDIAWSPGGERLASVGDDRRIVIYWATKEK